MNATRMQAMADPVFALQGLRGGVGSLWPGNLAGAAAGMWWLWRAADDIA